MDQLLELCDTEICPKMEQSLPLIGDAAPEFTASTTNGKIKFVF